MPGQLDMSQEKACKILEDGQVDGAPLTGAQRRMFGARCSGQVVRRAENGALVLPRDIGIDQLEVIHSLR